MQGGTTQDETRDSKLTARVDAVSKNIFARDSELAPADPGSWPVS